jgi:N-acetylglucosaminyldiphosphoundecaprenol N-acetyl-beta-D-mannosaminyltransferase
MDWSTVVTIGDELSREVYCLLGIPIDVTEMSAVLRRIDDAVTNAAPFLISTPNLNFLVNSLDNPEFRESLLQSDLCPPDGVPIIWIARLLGIPIKSRVAGSDIFEALRLRPRVAGPLKIFFFGATEPVAAAAAARLNCVPIGLKCVGWACPGYVGVDELSEDRFINQINASNADFLVAALGARNGQVWLLRNHGRLQVPVRAHLGATINFQAGTVKRAPRFVQKLGFEWLWRIKEEPALFARYWHDGSALVRQLTTRVLPLAVIMLCRKVLSGRHDLVIVADENIDGITIRLSGDATATEVPGAVAHLREAVGRGKPIEIDLSSTKTVDARFLGLFLMLRKQVKESGNVLSFNKLPVSLQRQFRLAGAEYLLLPDKR